MSITTLAGAISNLMPPVSFNKAASGTLLAGAPASTFPIANGFPAGGALTAGLNGGTYSTSSAVPAGIIPRKDPTSGNAYLARLQMSSSLPGKILLCDRLWDNTLTINSTSAQSITSPTWPARDAAGTTNGLGLHLGLEVSAATSGTAAAWTASYTNSAGGAGKTSSSIDTTTAAAAGIGRFYRMSWAAGDVGIQSIQSCTFTTAWTSGTVGLVIYRVLAMIDLQIANWVNAIEALSGGFTQLYNGTSPFFIFESNNTTSATLAGIYQETQG
jgi:hypothetical protein